MFWSFSTEAPAEFIYKINFLAAPLLSFVIQWSFNADWVFAQLHVKQFREIHKFSSKRWIW